MPLEIGSVGSWDIPWLILGLSPCLLGDGPRALLRLDPEVVDATGEPEPALLAPVNPPGVPDQPVLVAGRGRTVPTDLDVVVGALVPGCVAVYPGRVWPRGKAEKRGRVKTRR